LTPPELPEPPEDGEEEHDGDAEEETADEAPEVAPPRRRGRRQSLSRAKRDDLIPWVRAEGTDIGAERELILRGSGIGSVRADLDKLSGALSQLATILRRNGAEPFLSARGVVLGNSAHVYLVPASDEIRRAERSLSEAAALESTDAGKTKAGQKRVHTLLRAAVPDLDVALALTGALMEAPVDETPMRAAELGQNVAEAYKSLATTLSKGGLTLEVPVIRLDEEAAIPARAVLGYGKAERVALALKSPSEPVVEVVDVIGQLSLADSNKKLFGLDLDRNRPIPEALRRKRMVKGHYTAAVEDVIVQQGLWNTRVLASIEIEKDALISTSRIRPPEFRLVGVVAAD
jgi:hypothetical protein